MAAPTVQMQDYRQRVFLLATQLKGVGDKRDMAVLVRVADNFFRTGILTVPSD